jgi:dihydrofolate synthase/folylpolyglutamate synthase
VAFGRDALPYEEALAWLYSLQLFGIKLGLENIQRLLAALGVTFRGARVVHVAGTNGKGSVCAMVDSICRAGGYRTGLFTSPHLVTFRERIRVDGKMISEDEVAICLTSVRDIIQKWDPHPTFFEIVTAMALKYFGDRASEVIILETGMGGRLDATNAVPSDVAVITPIGLDHQKWLGQTMREIAGEKAGIIKSAQAVISAEQSTEAEEVLTKRSHECGATLEFVQRRYRATSVNLRGVHQQQNAALAVKAVRAAGIDLERAAIARGLASVEWPARFQFWDERTVIDGAHNPAAARALSEAWREVFNDRRATLIIAVLADKDVRAICEILGSISDFVLLPKIRSARAAEPEDIAAILSSITPLLPHSTAPSFANALATARTRPNPVLITGSLHFAGEALAHLQGRPAAFEECAQ